MADSYDFSVDVLPAELKPGSTVSVRVQVTAGVDDVHAVSLSMPEYSIWEACRREGPGLFIYQGTVPWEAPADTYQLNVIARDEAGQVKRAKVVPVRVV